MSSWRVGAGTTTNKTSCSARRSSDSSNIIGEALNRLSKVDSATADRVPDLARFVAFRNVLVHGYAQIDDALVWEVASTRVPELTTVLAGLLD
ncbi:DUF86 domain-containing protein [Aeromicrobium sp.]|uniref:HepT-like ribonuclease domain-containing protein n=1 Tax=Aeromicrobium sp. TaxID=1871063 RepID=UPI0025C5EABC|nr:DUF86 domain-containing protein [Aeromicrobium sp.]